MTVLALAAGITACGISARKNLAAVPVGQVGFDDLCGVQEYFDTLAARGAMAPKVVRSVETEKTADGQLLGGKAAFLFNTDFQIEHLRRVVQTNWTRLPPEFEGAKRVELEVHWSEKAGIRRVATNVDSALTIGKKEFPLPYHVCLSEFLYGAPLYKQRRELMGLPPIVPEGADLGHDALGVDGGVVEGGAMPGDGGPAKD